MNLNTFLHCKISQKSIKFSLRFWTSKTSQKSIIFWTRFRTFKTINNRAWFEPSFGPPKVRQIWSLFEHVFGPLKRFRNRSIFGPPLRPPFGGPKQGSKSDLFWPPFGPLFGGPKTGVGTGPFLTSADQLKTESVLNVKKGGYPPSFPRTFFLSKKKLNKNALFFVNLCRVAQKLIFWDHVRFQVTLFLRFYDFSQVFMSILGCKKVVLLTPDPVM